MRKKDDTMQGTLLRLSREIADTQGISAVNIRTIAKKAGVATGTVYNYFSSKDEILLALTEEYWKQALLEMDAAVHASSFCGQLQEIFAFLKEQINLSAGKLMNSLDHTQETGQAHMQSMQAQLEASFIQRMEQDTAIRKDIWDTSFTKAQFAHFIMMNMMMLLKSDAPGIAFLIAVIKRIIY